MYEKFKLVIEILGALALVYLVADLLYWVITGDTDKPADKFQRWLKGHREYYFIGQEGLVKKEQRPLRLRAGEVNWRDDAIVIERRPFFRRAEVYGKGRDNWSVSIQEKRWEDPRIFLQDKRNRSVEEVLNILRRHSSLQALGDDFVRAREDRDRAYGLNEELRKRVAGLENRNKQLENWYAGTVALARFIDEDRLNFRSKPAHRIRLALAVVLSSANLHNEPVPPEEKVLEWLGKMPPVNKAVTVN